MENRKKRALLTGITGQDGAYLAEYLLGINYEVHGIIRRSSSFNTGRIEHLYEDPHVGHRNFILHYGDLTDSTNLISILNEVKPDEVYNLAAQSHVKVSFEMAEYTANVDALGALRLLDAIRSIGLEKKQDFIRLQLQNFMVALSKNLQMKTRPFILVLPMQLRNNLGFGSQKIIERLMECMQAMEFYLIMRAQEEDQLL